LPTVDTLPKAPAAPRSPTAPAAGAATATDQASLFSQFLDLIEGAIGIPTAVTAPTTDDTTGTATTSDKDDAGETASSDLAAQIAAQMQGAGVQFATAAGVASPADLGARNPGPSQTSAANAGVDGRGTGAVGAAGPGASLTIDAAATAGTAAAAPPTADAAATTGAEEATAAGFAGSLAAQTARRSDAAEARDGETTPSTNTTTETDPLGLTSLKGRAARTARSDGTPLTYRAPQSGAANAEAAKTAAVADAAKAAATNTEAAKENATTEAVAADRALLAQQAQKGTPMDSRRESAGDEPTTVEARPSHPDGDATAVVNVAQARQAAAADATVQAARPTPVIHAVALAAVAETIATQANRGRSRFEMRLEPADLGRIDVSLSVGAAGDVKAHLVVERPETLDMMMRDQRNLERSLANAGLDVGSSGLQFSLRGDGDRRGSDQPPPPVVTTSAEEDAAPVVPEIAAIAYRSSRIGALDLRV
jgi:hypothetical protein